MAGFNYNTNEVVKNATSSKSSVSSQAQSEQSPVASIKQNSAKDLVELIMGIYAKASDRDLTKDLKSIDDRIVEASRNEHIGLLLILAGKDDGKILLNAQQEKSKAISQKSMIESNPEGYKAVSALNGVFGDGRANGVLSQVFTFADGLGQSPQYQQRTYVGQSKIEARQDFISKAIYKLPSKHRSAAFVAVQESIDLNSPDDKFYSDLNRELGKFNGQ